MATNNHDIRVLNSLIATTLDSADGYTEAAKAGGARFATIFSSLASDRDIVVSQLQSEVARLGGTPAESGTVLASAHRMFLNLKMAVTGSDDQAIVNEVERGEDHIKTKYEDALDDDDLSQEVRAMIGNSYQSVCEGHDEMGDLERRLEATKE